ncbi:MAG: aldehyde dehydrogenase family protein [Thermodesulfobacteriota bacterium]|nr:aldehyde dehydrogenase family protein [Thermodesulfobacteriota bacterium]
MTSTQQAEAISPDEPNHTPETPASEPSYDKATGETIGHSPMTTKEELETIIARAREAQRLWAKTPVRKRAARIRKISREIVRQCDKLTVTISRDNGKTRTDALVAEVLPATLAVPYYAKNAKKLLKDRFLMPGNIALSNKVSRIVRVPFGVVGIISPWNYPFSIPFSEVIMALLAGNAVVLKTASETQMVGQALKTIMESAGLPPYVFNYVNMKGRVAGDAFLEGGVDKLFFTGSVPVGKYLMGKASETLTPVSLELGGNDAMIVCPDADLDRAAAGAVWAGFQNAGQSCGGVERIYVHKDIYDGFLARLKERTERLRVGYGCDFTTDIGVMTTERQVETVNDHVRDALDRGAEIFARARADSTGTRQLKNSIAPMVLTNVTHNMKVMAEETFGPVVGVMKVDTIDDAIALANDSDLGLTGSVWSKNRKNAVAVARRIQAGAITINDHLMSHGLAEAPWGGFKKSSIGRTHGKIGFDEMTEPQVIVSDIMPFVKKNLWWHPHGRGVYDGLKGLLESMYGEKRSDRLKGALKILRLAPRMFFR